MRSESGNGFLANLKYASRHCQPRVRSFGRCQRQKMEMYLNKLWARRNTPSQCEYSVTGKTPLKTGWVQSESEAVHVRIDHVSHNGYSTRRKALKSFAEVPSRMIGLSALDPSTFVASPKGRLNIVSKGVPLTKNPFFHTENKVCST